MNISRFTRITAALAAAVLIAAALFGCAGPAETPDQTATSAAAVSTEPETESPYDVNGYLKDDIPADLKFPGTVIRMLYWNDVQNIEFFVDEDDGDLVRDSIFTRNLKVEERLGVTIDYNGIKGNYDNRSNYLNSAQNAVNGGDNYDIYAAYSMSTAMCAYEGLCLNLLAYDVIDLDKPWWPNGLIRESTINNKLYFCSGDLSTNFLYQMYTLFFNKAMIEDYKLDSPYDHVDNNTWTYEKLFEMASAAAGDASATAGVYGFTTTTNVYVDPFFFAAGLRVLDRDGSGELVISELFNSERTNDVADAVYDFLHAPHNKFDDTADGFSAGRVMFHLDCAEYSKDKLGKASFEYGAVPMPKYDAEQENYSTTLGFPYTLYAISVSSENDDAAAAVLECLCSEGHRNIVPALFEITMKVRYTSDSQAGRMYDIIRESASFDVGRIFTANLGNIPYSLFRGNVTSTSGKVAYSVQAKAQVKVLERNLESLKEAFNALP